MLSNKERQDAGVTVTCYNCGKVSHYARDRKKDNKTKDHIRASHMVIADDPGPEGNKNDQHHERVPSICSSQCSAGSRGHQEVDDLVEIDVYNNDWYEHEFDAENMFTMQDIDHVLMANPQPDKLTMNDGKDVHT